MFLIHGAEFYQIAKKQPNTADLEFFPELDPRYEEACPLPLTKLLQTSHLNETFYVTA